MKIAFATRVLAFVLPCVLVAQTAVLQVKIVEGEGAVHAPGTRVAKPITVEVTDEVGRPVAGAAVSFRLPPQGPSGTFSSGLLTDVVFTDANGRAAVRGVQLNHVGGTFQIRITAAKGLARAGVVSNQFISGKGTDKPSNAGTRLAVRSHGSHKKAIAISLLLAAAAGGGSAYYAVNRRRSTASAAAGQPPTLGMPTISIGRP